MSDGATDGKWRRRFVEYGLDGLLDEPRPGVPRTIDDAKVESVIVQTLESPPGRREALEYALNVSSRKNSAESHCVMPAKKPAPKAKSDQK